MFCFSLTLFFFFFFFHKNLFVIDMQIQMFFSAVAVLTVIFALSLAGFGVAVIIVIACYAALSGLTHVFRPLSFLSPFLPFLMIVAFFLLFIYAFSQIEIKNISDAVMLSVSLLAVSEIFLSEVIYK